MPLERKKCFIIAGNNKVFLSLSFKLKGKKKKMKPIYSSLLYCNESQREIKVSGASSVLPCRFPVVIVITWMAT